MGVGGVRILTIFNGLGNGLFRALAPWGAHAQGGFSER